MEKILNNIIKENKKWTSEGKVASYIPELSKMDSDLLGVSVYTLYGDEYSAGDSEVKFTIQSISKIITLMLAIIDNGKDYVFSRIGMEPTDTSFNSIVNLEIKDPNKPVNPMINAGAIATVSLIKGESAEDVFQKILSFTRKISDNPNIVINENVYRSEKRTGDRNRALAYYMKSTNVLDGNVDEILDVYFKQCSIEVTCRDLAKIGAMLANDGVMPWNNERVISKDIARIIKTIMVTCGMYDASGKFAVEIGVPAKSGVGGGILCCVPKKMGIAVLGPALDKKGNSIAGMKVMKDLSKELNLSIF